MDIAKITALTGAQARQLGKYAKECLALGLCRDSIDEAAAEKYGKSLVNWLEFGIDKTHPECVKIVDGYNDRNRASSLLCPEAESPGIQLL